MSGRCRARVLVRSSEPSGTPSGQPLGRFRPDPDAVPTLGRPVHIGGVMATTGAAGDFPVPAETTDLAGFVRALRDIKVWAGNPSLETLRRRTGIATSTLSDAFSMQRRRLPSIEIVRALVEACGAGRA